MMVTLQQQIEQPASIHKPGHQSSPNLVIALLVQQDHAGGDATGEASSWDSSCARQQGVHVDLLHGCSAGWSLCLQGGSRIALQVWLLAGVCKGYQVG